MSPISTAAPASANRRAMARPRPLAPPVTTARLACNEIRSSIARSVTSAIDIRHFPPAQSLQPHDVGHRCSPLPSRDGTVPSVAQEVTPFRIEISDASLDDLIERLVRPPWPQRATLD